MSKTFIWVIHFLYWTLFIALLVMIYALMAAIPGFERGVSGKNGGFIFWIRLMTGFALIPALISFYGFYGFLFNRFLSKKRFMGFSILGILLSILAALTGALVESTRFLFGPKFLFGDSFSSAFSILTIMTIGALINGVTGTMIKGFITWYNDIRLKEELMKKNYETELSLIKSQVNPHFLFNTLNNIDVLIDKDKTKASDYIKKLSDILRFMLYETKTGKIPITQELIYIEKYIALQKLRTPNPSYVDFRIRGNPGDRMSEPMLFIPFIENAFKHSDNKKEIHGIRIHFDFMNDSIDFMCSNNYAESNRQNEPESGLGNGLIEKRLQLLYPGRHRLTILKENARYTVKLIIQE